MKNTLKRIPYMKAATFSIFLFLILPISLSAQVALDDSWELINAMEHLKIYGRNVEDHNLKEILVEGWIDSSLPELVAALEDIEGQKDWVLATIDAFVISEKDAEKEILFYMSTDMPFPIRDRDIVLDYKRWKNPETGTIHTISKSAPEAYPKQSGYIRIPYFYSEYVLTEENGGVRINYFTKIDPGGWLPLWLVNMAVDKGPTKSFQSLYKIIKQGKYKNASVEGL